MSENKAKRMSSKRVVGVIALGCVAVVLLSLATASLDPDALVEKWFGEPKPSEQSIDFYPVDEQENIFEREDYMGLDRYVYYTDPMTGETFVPERDELAALDEGLPLLYDYLECILYGDEASYPLYFSTAYLEQNELPESFTMQMLYDVHIEPCTGEDGRAAYLVDYKIYRNNGTFRRDIGSNASRTLLISLVREQGELCIDGILPYTGY